MARDDLQLASHWWWRPGWQVGTRYYSWHVTMDDQPEVRRFAARRQEALRAFEALDVVPPQWLHITMQGLGHVSEVPDVECDAVVDAVRAELAGLSPAPVTFEAPVVYREAVAAGLTDPGPLREVRHGVRTAMARVLGRPAPGDDEYSPHVSLAYVNAPADPAGVRSALDAVVGAPVTTTCAGCR